MIFVDSQLSFIFARIASLMGSRLADLRTNGRVSGPGRPAIFEAFSNACGAHDSSHGAAWADRALDPKAGPRVQITETDYIQKGKLKSTYGTYYAGDADLLVIDDNLAIVAEYDLSRGYEPAADFLEAVLLHESVHWARRWSGLDPGTIVRNGGAIEAGHFFETLAYGAPMTYLSTWPVDYPNRLNDAQRFLSVNNVLMDRRVPVYKRPRPKLIW